MKKRKKYVILSNDITIKENRLNKYGSEKKHTPYTGSLYPVYFQRNWYISKIITYHLCLDKVHKGTVKSIENPWKFIKSQYART